MKRIEKVAVLIAILHVISTYAYAIGNWLVPAFAMNKDTFLNPLLFTVPLILVKLSVNIIIAVWIYRESKKDGADAPWAWAFFGFIFGISGAILFYAFRIYGALNRQKEANQSSEPTRYDA